MQNEAYIFSFLPPFDTLQPHQYSWAGYAPENLLFFIELLLLWCTVFHNIIIILFKYHGKIIVISEDYILWELADIMVISRYNHAMFML
jgi:hypothetical protein